MLKNYKKFLTKAGLKSDVFDDTVPDPTDTVVLKGIEFLEKCKNDAVIGFGGGSPMDTAKAIAAMANLVKIFKIINHLQCLIKKVYQ